MSPIIGPPKSRRRHWTFLWCLVVAIGLGIFYIPGALAVHNTGAFELDGNATSQTSNDWDRVCHQRTGSANCGTASNTSSPAALAVEWSGDCPVGSTGIGCGNINATIFTGGGSKDPQDINQWAWKDGAGGLPDKDNLLHSFAARFSLTATGPSGTCPNGTGGAGQPTFDATIPCEVLYFGSDRFDNSGDAQQGFWFFQAPVGLGTNVVGGGTGFTGLHTNGDLLVISDFSNGGTTATITVYKWDSACTKAVTKPNPGDCGDINLRLLATSDNAKCSSGLAQNDAFCGIVNPDNTTAVPWSSDYTYKSGNSSTYLQGELYEGGINLSALGLGGECFSSVASETRSSTSTTATLKDFVLGQFAQCGATFATQKTGGGQIGSDGTATISDAALISVSGTANPPAPDGSNNVKFYLCGPSATQITSCSVANGTLKAQVAPSTATKNGNVYTVQSGDITVTAAGYYCFTATWAGDTNYKPLAPATVFQDDGTNECLQITPVNPALHTQVSNAGPSNPGTTMHDTVIFDTAPAHPSNGSFGTITFTVYGPVATNTPTCTTQAAQSTATVQDGVTSYNSADFSPTAPGFYFWRASYAPASGDVNNTSAGPTGCGDANETYQVQKLQPSIATAQKYVLHDEATITVGSNSAGALAGTVRFRLYNNATCDTTAPN